MIINTEEMLIQVKKQAVAKNEGEMFGEKYKNSLSGNESLCEKIQEHIDELYDDRQKRFEFLMKNSMSSEEFVKRAHQHIKEVYAAKNRS